MASTNADVLPGDTTATTNSVKNQPESAAKEGVAECTLPGTSTSDSTTTTPSMGRMKSSPQSSSKQKTTKKAPSSQQPAESSELPLTPVTTTTTTSTPATKASSTATKTSGTNKNVSSSSSPLHHIAASGTSPPPAQDSSNVRRLSSAPANSSRNNTAASSGPPGATPAANSNKPCCFCWCCCYRCTCLSSKNQEEELSKSKDINSRESWSNDPEATPSVEEIRCWGDSFDRLMKSSMGRAVFREFLKCEYSEENILFWLACEDLKKDSNPEVVEEKARLIYEDYISILSPKEVSLDSRVREIVNRNMVDPTPHTFDEAQLQIYTLMHRDSYPRFVNSAYYKKLAQLSNTSRKESSA